MLLALIVVFLSKFRATTNYFSHTYLGFLILSKNLHDIHIYCGHYIAIFGTVHTLAHISRYASQNNLYLLFHSQSGVSGWIITGTMLLICMPMIFGVKRIRFEIRKCMHYLFLVFMVAFCFHVPKSGGFAPYIFGTLLVWWALDTLYVQLVMTERIKSSRFHVLPSGVQMTMAVSERFQRWGPGGYCYVCLPWVDRYQWHAFSLFENPETPHERQVFMEKDGDWTGQVHESLGRDTSRPVWIQGPFISPYDYADNYDNPIMVAGGIGITPALSVIRELKETRRCNLIWAVKCRHMLEFFVKHADFDDEGWNLIFYTGTDPLLGIEDVVVTPTGATIYIIRERPKLHLILPNIIYGIESGVGKPERLIPDELDVVLGLLQEKLVRLQNRDPRPGMHEKLSELKNYCDELGYPFNHVISQLPGADHMMNAAKGARFSMLRGSVLDAILAYRGPTLLCGEACVNKTSMQKSMRRIETIRLRSERYLAKRSAALKQGIGPSLSSTELKNETSEDINYDDDGKIEGANLLTDPEQFRPWSSSYNQAAEGDGSMLGSHILLTPELFRPWTYHEDAGGYVRRLGPHVLSTWGVLYCGGKTPLETNLKKAARKAGIEMHSESFAW